eukprot:scaffold25922_cov55-Attheya_sp.AAC.5
MEHTTLAQLCIDFDISTASVALYFVSSFLAFTVRRVVLSRKWDRNYSNAEPAVSSPTQSASY